MRAMKEGKRKLEACLRERTGRRKKKNNRCGERSEIRNDGKKDCVTIDRINYRQDASEILSEILLTTNNFAKFFFF